MVGLHGSAVLRAGRYLLPLAIPACCAMRMLLLFSSPPPEVAGVRDSFQPSVSLAEQRAVDTPPPPPEEERREIIDTSPSSPPPEHREIIGKPPPPPPERGEIMDTPPPPPARQAKTEMTRKERTETPSPPPPARIEKPAAVAKDRCSGRYIYIHELPNRFNSDLLRDCRSLSEWTDMCKHVANAGMGPRLKRTGGVLSSTGRYDTNQFTLEVIFHSRMRQYGCLTADASRAAAVYMPYYAGLDVGRHLWGSSTGVRDTLAEDFLAWLRSSPAWAAHGWRDHFLVGGCIAWDFRCEDGGEWGSRLLLLPEARNMTALVIESSPWHGNDAGVPYPTYFHPSGAGEVASWHSAVRRARRPWLFAFAGGVRARVHANGGVRDAVIGQCARSRRCGGRRNDCYAPGKVMWLFKSAAFCLQPQGDSYTRRSAFDAMLAGCVPVFFHPGSAYVQYRWHLPADHRSYSVFVPEDGVRNGTVRVEDVLRRFGAREVAAMREQVVRMIPSIVYRDPRPTATAAAGFRDAVDVAVDGVIERVRRIKRGLPPWDDEHHQWDGYFN